MLKETEVVADIGYAEERLREWGWQCGNPDPDSRRPYRDGAIKEMMEVYKTAKQNRDAHKERKARRKLSARKAAETRRARRQHAIKICPTCGHMHYRECGRCKNDPHYSALGKQTRDFHQNLDGPILRITADAAQIDHLVGKLLPADMGQVLRLCYCDHVTPWRKHAWMLRMPWPEFQQWRESAVEAVADLLAFRNEGRI